MMHKTNQNTDLRVRRTEKAIFDALIQCTTEKGFPAVTVSDITLTAEINRATFYRHYKDKFDLLNSYAKTVFDMLDEQKKLVKKRGTHTFPAGLVNIFEHVRDNATFYRVMWGKNGDPAFTEKIREYIQKRIRHSLPENLHVDKNRIDLFITYSANASFGAVLWWLEHDMSYSPEEMIRILQHLESENLKAILK